MISLNESLPITVDGKHFRHGQQRFPVRGITYGTFAPRAGDAARFPASGQIADDFAAMRDAGFNVVRTYTEPPADVLGHARDNGLKVLAGVFYEDWRYLIDGSMRERARVARRARSAVREAARRLAGSNDVFALSVGNEIPADVIRWVGVDQIAGVIADLVDVCRQEDPDRLVTYSNYPTAEYLPLDALDFVTFNVYLERKADLRKYLNRLHHVAGDRPILLGEIGLHAPDDYIGELEQAAALDWQLETALERGMAGTCVFSWTDEWHVGDAAVTDWNFGITRRDRTPKLALDVVRRWNQRTVADLDAEWPSISVVICAYNAAATLDECLRHCVALEYPQLEIVVVDDGSTDATAAIAASFERVRLVEIEHAGLGAARNAGFHAAGNDLIAYLDSDAYPTPEWPFYLALGLDARDIGGVGGPNVSPPADATAAQAVACAPGGPAHVLLGDDRAEHVPGCNMAFWKTVLEEVDGFDPAYTSAGDDVDICWKVLDAGWRIAFHPAALVWHHRRAGARTYLRQQRGYGRAESLVAARHPHRFTRLGTARWKGVIYQSGTRPSGSAQTYRGLFGSAAFQSVYRTPSHALDVAHQLGTPLALAALATAPLAAVSMRLGLIALFGVAVLITLFAIDVARVRPPTTVRERGWRFRPRVAVLQMLQPLARAWGRTRRLRTATSVRPAATLPGPATTTHRGVILIPADRPRERLTELAIHAISASGVRATAASAWSDVDATLHGSALVRGQLITSAFPVGAVQIRLRLRIRPGRTVTAAGAIALLWWQFGGIVALCGVAVAGLDTVRGVWRAGRRARRAVRRAASTAPVAVAVEDAMVDRWDAPVTFQPELVSADRTPHGRRWNPSKPRVVA